MTDSPDRWNVRPHSGWYAAWGKRCLDVTVAALALLLLSPLLAVVALCVRLSSPGPVLFRQKRVGKDFRPFEILKFRTMVADAPRLGGPLTRGTADPRITTVGRWLRRAKLDELPQLWNVLRGDMSLVGPRPEVSRYVELFQEAYRTILRVRPGITDDASLKYRNESDLLEQVADPEQEYLTRILPDKLALGQQYVARMSLTHDIYLLFATLAATLSGRR